MSHKLLEMKRKRANLVNQARQLVDTAEKEKRQFTQEDQNAWDGWMQEADQLRATIEREERTSEAEASLERNAFETHLPDPNAPTGEQTIQFVSRGMRYMNEQVEGWREEPLWRQLFPTAEVNYRAAYRTWMRRGVMQGALNNPEVRALQADSDTLGGYLITPLQLVDALIKAIDDQVYIRQWATVLAVPNAEALGIPTLDTDPADADWTSELLTGNEDSSMAFGRRSLSPNPLAKRIKISNKLLSKIPSSEMLVMDRLAYKFGVTFEKGCLTGSGSGQPLGVFTASANGISTGRDVSTDNTTTAVTMDGLINAKYALKPQYLPRARWLGHRDLWKMVAKLKDGSGAYIWQPSVQQGQPDRLLNVPAFSSEYAPNTFTTGLYVGIIGDFSQYWIADSMAMSMQRLVELYAATNQVGIIGRLESDGMPVLEEAFARVKLA